jgi:glycosyltransferase involved in cell wall biosynthesis
MSPEIAVLMPVYNPSGEEITRTLKSLRAQDEPYHLYLVDDGSTNKPKYREWLRGMPHTLIELPTNLGITGALNAGLEAILAKPYKYIARIDCGDVALPERFRKQKLYFEKKPDISIIGTDFKMVNPHLEGAFYVRRPDDPEILALKLQYNTPLSHPTMMIRPDLFRSLGLSLTVRSAADATSTAADGYQQNGIGSAGISFCEVLLSLCKEAVVSRIIDRNWVPLFELFPSRPP